MTKNTVNPADGIERVFEGTIKGITFTIAQSPLIPKMGYTTKTTITGRN